MKVKILLMVMAGVAGLMAGCTANHSGAPAAASSTASPSADSLPSVLPSFPSNITGVVLLQQTGGAGSLTLTTRPAKAGKLTVEAACVDSTADSKMTLTVASPSGHVLFSTNGSPCLGEIRNVGLTVAASQGGYAVKINVPSGGRYSVLVTQ